MLEENDTEIQLSYYNAVSEALSYLAAGLKPFVEQQLRQRYREAWQDNIASVNGHAPILSDPYIILTTINDRWSSLFDTCIKVPHSVVKELREVRNAATHHDEAFSADRVNNSISSMLRILRCIPPSQSRNKAIERIEKLQNVRGHRNGVASDKIQTIENDRIQEGQTLLQKEQVAEQSQPTVVAPVSQDDPAVTYSYNRLCFRADRIEPLEDNQAFRVVTPAGAFQMTKAEFYRTFPKVVVSKSYVESKIYHYPSVPKSALPYKLSE